VSWLKQTLQHRNLQEPHYQMLIRYRTATGKSNLSLIQYKMSLKGRWDSNTR
jgi:hypothetical protein